MFSASTTKMLAAIAGASDPDSESESSRRFGRALIEAPEDASALLEALARSNTSGAQEESLSRLLGAALDEARMARENGQQRGNVFIERLEAQLRDFTGDRLTAIGRLLVARTWVRVGLSAPDCLALASDEAGVEVDPAEAEAMFDDLMRNIAPEAGASISVLHTLFAELLPTLPPEVRQALVRHAVARQPEVYADLGCAWLLEASSPIGWGAVAGLSDRLATRQLSAQVVTRLTILRSWLADAELRAKVDDLIREAMRRGIGTGAPGPEVKLRRIVASLIDGSGAQSMAAAVQRGGTREVAVVLLKQGHGVKDAYVLPCSSATEQRDILDTITHEIEAFEVPRDYMAQAIGLALSEGLAVGLAPVPGLVEVVQACGFADLRPLPSSVVAILALADPKGEVAGLSVQSRGRLINASADWEEDYPMLASWFEDGDETTKALEGAKSDTGLTRAMWTVLEGRSSHWARIIARNAHLLQAGGRDTAPEFTAVAAALEAGRDMRKIPVMSFVCDLSIQVWLDRTGGTFEADHDQPFPENLSPRRLPAIAPEKRGELAKMLDPAGLSEPWLAGYLTGVCTAPVFVSPADWFGPLLHLAEGGLRSEAKAKRFVDLVMQRYNGTVTVLQDKDAALLPDLPLVPLWADGYLTCWEATKPHWPAKAMGPLGKSLRKVLEGATDGRIDRVEVFETLPSWLRTRFAQQTMDAPKRVPAR